MCAAGTFEGRIEEGRRSARMMVAITAAGAAACVLAMAAVVAIPSSRPATLYASMDKRDGSDALVNAILVARGSRCCPQSWPRSKSTPSPPLEDSCPSLGTRYGWVGRCVSGEFGCSWSSGGAAGGENSGHGSRGGGLEGWAAMWPGGCLLSELVFSHCVGTFAACPERF